MNLTTVSSRTCDWGPDEAECADEPATSLLASSNSAPDVYILGGANGEVQDAWTPAFACYHPLSRGTRAHGLRQATPLRPIAGRVLDGHGAWRSCWPRGANCAG
jgi:hypothetical protein